ncbi:MAG: TIGR02757 family protein [Treponema sp.]|nr:TIGR02757 family protein [Treponema sp.]
MKLKQELDKIYKKVCTPAFINDDPLQFPHYYKKRNDIEIAVFLSAAIAWGNRKMIINSCKKMFALMGKSPYEFVMSGEYKKLKNKNIHRTFFETDLKYFCNGFKYCYDKYKNLENLFLRASAPAHELIWNGLVLFRKEMAKGNRGLYSKHISDPEKSACKRLNLALRWLVRPKPVDLGLWKNIKPNALYIPLDVHVARTARKLGLLTRKSNDKKAVIELTENLRNFCPKDPVKYDFALFGIGVKNGTLPAA